MPGTGFLLEAEPEQAGVSASPIRCSGKIPARSLPHGYSARRSFAGNCRRTTASPPLAADRIYHKDAARSGATVPRKTEAIRPIAATRFLLADREAPRFLTHQSPVAFRWSELRAI